MFAHKSKTWWLNMNDKPKWRRCKCHIILLLLSSKWKLFSLLYFVWTLYVQRSIVVEYYIIFANVMEKDGWMIAGFSLPIGFSGEEQHCGKAWYCWGCQDLIWNCFYIWRCICSFKVLAYFSWLANYVHSVYFILIMFNIVLSLAASHRESLQISMDCLWQLTHLPVIS